MNSIAVLCIPLLWIYLTFLSVRKESEGIGSAMLSTVSHRGVIHRGFSSPIIPPFSRNCLRSVCNMFVSHDIQGCVLHIDYTQQNSISCFDGRFFLLL